MSTKRKKAGICEAGAFLQELNGGPLALGQALWGLRRCEDESMAKFAARLGISASYLSGIEKGSKVVSISHAARFAAALEHSERVFVRLAIRDQLRADGLDYDAELTG